MATEQSQEHADWRARQKERERERRRMRDRQRRQSMSVEEREKHLARRRRNYQLRRQRAATAQFGFEQTNMSNLGTRVESETLGDNLANVCVSDVNVQSDCEMQDAFNEAYEDEKALVMKDDGNAGETKFREPYKYPRLPRLNQIRRLARGLNASVDKMACVDALDAELVNPHSALESRIRLTHVKHLARALNSNVGRTCEQKMHGQEYNVVRMTDQVTSEGAFSNGAVKR